MYKWIMLVVLMFASTELYSVDATQLVNKFKQSPRDSLDQAVNVRVNGLLQKIVESEKIELSFKERQAEIVVKMFDEWVIGELSRSNFKFDEGGELYLYNTIVATLKRSNLEIIDFTKKEKVQTRETFDLYVSRSQQAIAELFNESAHVQISADLWKHWSTQFTIKPYGENFGSAYEHNYSADELKKVFLKNGATMLQARLEMCVTSSIYDTYSWLYSQPGNIFHGDWMKIIGDKSIKEFKQAYATSCPTKDEIKAYLKNLYWEDKKKTLFVVSYFQLPPPTAFEIDREHIDRMIVGAKESMAFFKKVDSVSFELKNNE